MRKPKHIVFLVLLCDFGGNTEATMDNAMIEKAIRAWLIGPSINASLFPARMLRAVPPPW